MNSRTREELKQQKRIFEIMGFNYIDFNDKRIINYVAKSLKNVETGAYVSFGSVSYEAAVAGGLENLKVLGMELYFKTSRFISVVPLMPVHPLSNGFACHVTYSVDDETYEVDKDSGTINHYKIPKNPDIMAPLHMGHEHIHALKETNYDEYIDGQVFGDIIPMLYEFIVAETYPELRKEVYRFRLYSLKEDFKHYDNAINQMMKSKTDKDLYKIIATRSGQYLNSYYYATILFNIYKNDSKMILELVNKVLNHEMTTRDMLESLGLLHKDNNVIFDSEFEEIKKCVKKV